MDAQTNSDRQGAEQAHSALPTNRATPMPKDNEVDEKVTKGIVATVCLVPHLSDHFAGVEMQLFGSYEPRIGDEFYHAATVAELRAEVAYYKENFHSCMEKLNAINDALTEADEDGRGFVPVNQLETILTGADPT